MTNQQIELERRIENASFEVFVCIERAGDAAKAHMAARFEFERRGLGQKARYARARLTTKEKANG